MNLKERFDYALHNLRYRPLRTWLTVLGIVIGIATIIILISLAAGLKANVEKQLSTFDTRVIVILPNSFSGMPTGGGGIGSLIPTMGKLYDKDYEKIKSIPGVSRIAKGISNRAPVKYQDKIISTSVSGIQPDVVREISTITVKEGRFLQSSDRGVAVLGHNIAHDTFDKKVEVGSTIEIAGRKYQVIGILDKSANTMVNFDNIIFIQFDEGRQIFSDLLLPNEISIIQVLVADGFDVQEVRENIEETLLISHRVTRDEKDFTVLDAKAVGKQVDEIIGILTIFLGAVATIAIIVGSIGVSNTMFMAVMERTHEIGVLKAIGATKKDILLTFMIEAGIIGLVGGLIGVVVGVLFSLSLIYVGVNTVITLELVVGSAVFAFIIGMIAGLIPAKNASEIPAIEALRYE